MLRLKVRFVGHVNYSDELESSETSVSEKEL